MLSYLIYYIVTLIFNSLLLSMYFVRVYEDFPNCIDSVSGQNYTFGFELSYGIGFLVVLAETLNINVLGIYLRYKVKREQRKDGFINTRTLLLQTLVDYC